MKNEEKNDNFNNSLEYFAKDIKNYFQCHFIGPILTFKCQLISTQGTINEKKHLCLTIKQL